MITPCLTRSLGQSTKALGFQVAKRPLYFTRLQSTTAKTTSKQAAAEVPETLTWPQYLTIRRNKRRWQTALTIPCALFGFGGGVLYFGSLEIDPTKPIMGIDPFFFYGICTVGCVGAGALVGPPIGSAIWRFTYRSSLPAIDARDREFFKRIAKNRVDATLQSPTQPVPDYYGEKIGSLHQYRQWLRDQAKYRRKALLPEV